MTSRYEIWIAGKALSSYSSNLLILDIQRTAAKRTFTTNSVAQMNGAFIDDEKVSQTSITVQFQLRIYDTAERQEVLDTIIKRFMAARTIRCSDRPTQELNNCICTAFPTIASAKKWTDTLSMTFTAYAFPFWEDRTATVKTLSGKSASGTLSVPGNSPVAYVAATITAANAITFVTVKVRNSTINLSGISIPKNGVITISYNANKIISIKYGSKSLLANRTADSSDNLIAVCNNDNAISISASDKIKCEFSVKGAWY